MLLVATGLRWGEAIGLRADRVDLLAARPRLTVVEQLQEMASTGELVFQSPKTVKGRRTVSFTKKVALLLAPLIAGKASGEVVFTAPKGGLVRTRNFRRIWGAGVRGCRASRLAHSRPPPHPRGDSDFRRPPIVGDLPPPRPFVDSS
nr:tyrosine-type recombinase/integrase [Salinispora mooreana]